MTAYMETCHVCGHVMSSDAPACPGCFAKSDPLARDAVSILRQAEMEREQAEEERAADENDRFVTTLVIAIGVAVLVLAAIIIAKA
jgi:hypothetical protein